MNKQVMTLLNGDCLEEMKKIDSGSVDLIVCDLPYGTIKGMGRGGLAKEKGYSSAEWDVLVDTSIMFEECNRVLRNNGKACLFSQQPFTTELITKAVPNMPYSYSMYWDKKHFSNCLSSKKACVNYIEEILLFSKNHQKHDFKGFHPLRDYSKKIMDFVGLNIKQINGELGHRRAEHFFYVNSTQFSICTEKTYLELVTKYCFHSEDWFKTFDEIKAVDRAYRENLIKTMNEKYPSVFNLSETEKKKSNLFEYKKDFDGFHPTQKPVALLEDLIRTFSNENDTVLDMTMGSGSTGVSCVNTNRNFIGIELDEDYFNIAKERIEKLI